MRLSKPYSALLVMLFLMCGPLPPSPDEMPEHAKAAVLAIDGSEQHADLIELKAGTPVKIRFGLTNSQFIDSIIFTQWINNNGADTSLILTGSWEKDTIDTSFVFTSSGTGTLQYTVFRNGARPVEEKVIFNISESDTNTPPVWNDSELSRTSMMGDRADLNLGQHVTDKEGDLLSFSISGAEDTDFNIDDDSLLVTDGGLDTGKYEFTVTVSDGALSASATVVWRITPVTDISYKTVPDTVSANSGEKTAIDVLKNDSIISGEGTLHVTSAGGCKHGSVSSEDTGVSYTSESDYSGPDLFYYIVNDRDTGWVFLTVKGPAEKRTVTFDKNNPSAGGAMDPQVIESGAKAGLNTVAFTMAGYTFGGWATTPEGEVAFADEAEITMDSDDITLYAVWIANAQHSITFDKNDALATGSMAPQPIPAGATEPLDVNTYTKEGWAFLGWATSESGEVAYGDRADYNIGTSDVVLYAVWSASEFAVTYDKNDPSATGSMLPQTFSSGSSAPLTENAFEKNGWSFKGWSTTPDGDTAYTDMAIYTMGSENVTLYAIWTAKTFTITFDKNDGQAGGTMAPQSVKSGSSASLTENAFNKVGWEFTGWATTPDGEKAYPDGATFRMGTGNDTLYAVWMAKSYTVTFDKNDTQAGGTMAPQSIKYGSSAALTANAFTKGGWGFAGWATLPDGDVVYPNGASYRMETENDTLYAVWSANMFTVTFNKNDAQASGTMAAQSINSGSSAALTANAFTKNGWSFRGWATSPDGGLTYTDGAPYSMGTQNDTLYAIWKVNYYQLEFDANTGTGQPPATASCRYDTSISIPGAGGLQKEGFDFTGWNTRANGSGATFLENAEFVMGATDTTLFAQWKKKKFTISVSAGDHGTVNNTLLTVEYGGSSPQITATSDPNYVFAGWTGDTSGTTTPLVIANVKKNYSITATFKIKSYTVTFKAATGGNLEGTLVQNVDHGGNCTAVTAIPGSNYYFKGWAYSDGSVSTANPLQVDTVTAAHTITAQFSPNQGSSDTSLVAYWSFDDTLGTTYYDVTGHGYNASSEGVTRVDGIRGKALHCPGSGFDMEVANSADSFNLSTYTMETWFYSEVKMEEMTTIMKLFDFQKIDNNIWNGYGMQINSGGKVVYSSAKDNSAWVSVASGTVLQSQTWYHIVGTYDGEAMKLYINGELEDSLLFSGTYAPPQANARIGCQKRAGGSVIYYTDGYLDEMKLYKKALPADAVKEIYEALKP